MDYTNTGNLYSGEDQDILVASASAEFTIADENVITMTKTVDRPEGYYFPGDLITFTITITNAGNSEANNLFFTDTLDEVVVPVTGTQYTVTSTAGTITSRVNPITVTNIDIPAGGSVTIIITGRIAE